MDKLDVLMVILSIISYFAIKIDARNYDYKVQRYENLRARQKLYLDQRIATKVAISDKVKRG